MVVVVVFFYIIFVDGGGGAFFFITFYYYYYIIYPLSRKFFLKSLINNKGKKTFVLAGGSGHNRPTHEQPTRVLQTERKGCSQQLEHVACQLPQDR